MVMPSGQKGCLQKHKAHVVDSQLEPLRPLHVAVLDLLRQLRRHIVRQVVKLVHR